MTFLEALQVACQDHTKMAVPIIAGAKIGIVFTPDEHPCWGWSDAGIVRLPAPKVLFGEWEVKKRT